MKKPSKPSMSIVNRALSQSSAPVDHKVTVIEGLTGGPRLSRDVTARVVESVRSTPRPATTSFLAALTDAVYAEQLSVFEAEVQS